MPTLKKVLLIDDEPDITLLVSSLLEFSNFKVTTLNDSTLVIEAITKGEFDVVVTDIMMPNLDGFALIKKIRAQDATKELKLMALSAKDFTEADLQFFLDNNVTLVKKPYEPQDLVIKINDLFT